MLVFTFIISVVLDRRLGVLERFLVRVNFKTTLVAGLYVHPYRKVSGIISWALCAIFKVQLCL